MKSDLKILLENSRVIAVDKDANTAVHGGNGISENETLLYQVKQYLGPNVGFVAPAHRLDRNTRGPVLFAKDRGTALAFRRIFASGEVNKTYSVLVEGKLSAPVFIEADIVKSHKKAYVRNLKTVTDIIPDKSRWLSGKDSRSGTVSATLILPEKQYRQTTLCSVETWTGRYHQIRAVCEAIGHPVCGDTKYNHDPRNHYNRRTRPDYPNGQMLLCKKIEIPSMDIRVTSGFELIPKNRNA